MSQRLCNSLLRMLLGAASCGCMHRPTARVYNQPFLRAPVQTHHDGYRPLQLQLAAAQRSCRVDRCSHTILRCVRVASVTYGAAKHGRLRAPCCCLATLVTGMPMATWPRWPNGQTCGNTGWPVLSSDVGINRGELAECCQYIHLNTYNNPL